MSQLPDPQTLGLAHDVTPEAAPGQPALIFWHPTGMVDGRRTWERVSSVPRAALQTGPGYVLVPATALVVRDQSRGFWQRLRFWNRATVAGTVWWHPSGVAAEQMGQRQSDVMLAWSDGDCAELDEHTLRVHWPQARRVQRLGQRLFLLAGILAEELAAGPRQPGEAPPLALAQQRLERARAAGDLAQVALALTDLGALYLHAQDADRAVECFKEAVAVAREAGDKSAEGDALNSLGRAWLNVGHLPCAREVFQHELSEARSQGDTLAEKLALGWLALIHSTTGDFAGAVRYGEEALRLAEAVGDRSQQAKLLQQLSIDYAELGQAEEAVARAEAAAALHEALGTPGTVDWTSSLQAFRAAVGQRAAARREPAALGGPIVVGIQPALAANPGLLRMAASAMKAAVGAVGSGFQIVPAPAYHARLAACATCSQFTGMRCKVCGCFTSIKAWLPHEDCPLGHWPSPSAAKD